MRILYLGDIVGEKTIDVLKANLEQIKKDHKMVFFFAFFHIFLANFKRDTFPCFLALLAFFCSEMRGKHKRRIPPFCRNLCDEGRIRLFVNTYVFRLLFGLCKAQD